MPQLSIPLGTQLSLEVVLGTDVSYWQIIPPPYAEMAKEGFYFAIVKVGGSGGHNDVRAEMHLQAAKDANMACMIYYWADPNVSWRTQLAHLLRLIEKYKPLAVALDFEQWWKSWDEWQKSLIGLFPKDKVRIVPPNQINDVYRLLADNLAAATDIPVLIYTGKWFIDRYCPQLATWIGRYWVWLARYVDLGKKYYNVTWEQLRKLAPIGRMPEIPSGVPITSVVIQQFTSRVIYPGYNGPLDTNDWKWGLKRLGEFLKFTFAPKEEPEKVMWDEVDALAQALFCRAALVEHGYITPEGEVIRTDLL